MACYFLHSTLAKDRLTVGPDWGVIGTMNYFGSSARLLASGKKADIKADGVVENQSKDEKSVYIVTA